MGVDYDLGYAVQQCLAVCGLKTLILDMWLVLGIDFGESQEFRTLRIELEVNKDSGTANIPTPAFKDVVLTGPVIQLLVCWPLNASLGSSYPLANSTASDVTS